MQKITMIAGFFGLSLLLCLLPLIAEASEEDSYGSTKPVVSEVKEAEIPEFFVTPPPLSEDTWPCSDCHDDMDVNPERRELTDMHEEIELKNHDEKNRWCLDCHNPDDRDMLRLASGKLVSFEESYLLCGQCHGTIFRDWKAGVHGRRTGEWNGKKIYRLCVNCHYPHQPRFKPIAPKPPPIKPKNIK